MRFDILNCLVVDHKCVRQTDRIEPSHASCLLFLTNSFVLLLGTFQRHSWMDGRWETCVRKKKINHVGSRRMF